MSENTKDYALIRKVLEDGGASRKEQLAAFAALERIKQNREWEVTRAANKARREALEQAAKLCESKGMLRASPAARLCAAEIRALAKRAVNDSLPNGLPSSSLNSSNEDPRSP